LPHLYLCARIRPLPSSKKRIELPEGAKLELEGKIDFGIFPHSFVSVPKAYILSVDGSKRTFENFYFGFNPLDLLKQGISFETAFLYGGVNYDGAIYIKDYESFYNHGVSSVTLRLESPIPVKVKGNLSHNNRVYSLTDFKISHKQSVARGNLQVAMQPNSGQKITVDAVVESENIDNIRRIIDFDKYDDDFNLLSGSGKYTFNLTTEGATSEELIAHLNGSGSVEIKDAAIYGLDLNEIIGAPDETQIIEDSDRKIDIKEASEKFEIKDGIATVTELTASNQFANINGMGMVDIVNELLQFNIDIDADVASARVNIPLTIAGTFDKVKFSPRVGDMVINNLAGLENLKDSSKVLIKNVKIKLDKANIGEAVDQLRNIGKGLGLDLDKITKGVTEGIGAPATPTAAPAQPAAPAAPAAPGEPAAPAAAMPTPQSLQIKAGEQQNPQQ
jgi:hypothetical protein